MSYTLEFSDDQLEELDLILRRELRESRGELRHTWDSGYKDRVRRHIELVESLVENVQAHRGSREHDVVSH